MSQIPDTASSLLRTLATNADSARWGEFIARYDPMLRAYLQSHFPRLEADDILQESFLALIKALPHYTYDPQTHGHFRNYLTGIVRNRALLACRKHDRTAHLHEAYKQEASFAQTAKSTLHDTLLELALRQLLADTTIAAQTKQIFIRVAINGEAPTTVADAFNITRNSVDQIKNRMIRRLRDLAQTLETLL